MRVTVTNREHARSYEVYLDGALLKDCVEANDESGVAIVFARNEHGHLYVEHSPLCRSVLVEEEIPYVTNGAGGGFITLKVPRCDCGLATKAVRGRVEIRRRRRIRDIWVSPTQD